MKVKYVESTSTGSAESTNREHGDPWAGTIRDAMARGGGCISKRANQVTVVTLRSPPSMLPASHVGGHALSPRGSPRAGGMIGCWWRTKEMAGCFENGDEPKPRSGNLRSKLKVVIAKERVTLLLGAGFVTEVCDGRIEPLSHSVGSDDSKRDIRRAGSGST